MALTVGFDVIRDLGNQFRKTLVAYRQHKEGDEHRNHLETELFSKLSAFCETHGYFHMGISAFCLTWDKKPIHTSQSKEDALAHVFYNDGVEQISFEDGIAPEELKAFCALWAEALWARDMDVQELVSNIWAADFEY